MSDEARHVELPGGTASYREAGAGIPAIITAGLGLTSRFYEQSYAPFAAAGIRLIVPDLPGWGDTPGPRTGLRAEQSAEFLLDFIAALGIQRAVWIGHSLGAQPVVRIAAGKPHRAAGIVLVGPTGAPGRGRRFRQALGLATEAGRTSAGVIAAVAREYLSTSPAKYIGTWLRHGGDDIVQTLPHVRCPALILCGDADPVSRAPYIELLRHRIPQARVEWVCGATHALPRGHAAEFNRAVIEFIRAL